MHIELLTTEHYRLLFITALIASIGFFDFMTFWYFADTLSHLFFATSNDAIRYWYIITAFGAGYLARPIGGWLIGTYGDRYGRKSALMLSFLGLTVFGLIIGMLPTFTQVGTIAAVFFVIARLAQGLAFGGQMPALWSYVCEQLPMNSIGFGCGIITASTLFSSLILVLFLLLLDTTLTQAQLFSFGWRLPFLLGATLGVIALYVAKILPEQQLHRSLSSSTSLMQHIKQHWQKIVSVGILSWCISSIITVVMVLLIDLIRLTFVLNNGLLDSAFILCLIFLSLGCILFGFLTDRINAGRVIAFGIIAFVASFSLLFYDLLNKGAFVLLTMSLVGLCSGVIGAMPAVMVRLCAPPYRLRILAISYNTIYALTGMLTAPLLGFLTFYADFAPVFYLAFVCIITLFLCFSIYYNPHNQEQYNVNP